MAIKRYLKLGESANSFYDPQTGLSLIPGEIKEILPAWLQAARVKRFLKGGGLLHSSKEEYNQYLNSLKKPKVVEESEEDGVDENPLKGKTLAELKEHVTTLNWSDEDVEAAQEMKKKSQLLTFIEETEAQYE